MPLVREDSIKQIEHLVAVLQFELENRVSTKLYDGNLIMEDISAGLLNLVYGWNLKNANSYHYDEPGIDLIDRDNKIAVQVTSTKTSKKIQHSIDEFLEHNDESIDGFVLFMLILTGKQKKYSADFDTKGRLVFSESQILDFPTILNAVKTMPIDRMLEIQKYLESELGAGKSQMEDRESIERKFACQVLDFLKPRRVLANTSLKGGGHRNLQYCSLSILDIKKFMVDKRQEMIQQNFDDTSDLMKWCYEIILASNQYLTWMDEHPECSEGCVIPPHMDRQGVMRFRNMPGFKTLSDYCERVNAVIEQIKERYSLSDQVTMSPMPDKLMLHQKK